MAGVACVSSSSAGNLARGRCCMRQGRKTSRKEREVGRLNPPPRRPSHSWGCAAVESPPRTHFDTAAGGHPACGRRLPTADSTTAAERSRTDTSRAVRRGRYYWTPRGTPQAGREEAASRRTATLPPHPPLSSSFSPSHTRQRTTYATASEIRGAHSFSRTSEGLEDKPASEDAVKWKRGAIFGDREGF